MAFAERLKSEPRWEHKKALLEVELREEADWGISLKYHYISSVARQGNSPTPQTDTEIAPSTFGTRFSVSVLMCMQLLKGVLVSLFPGIMITWTTPCEWACQPGGLGGLAWLVQVNAVLEMGASSSHLAAGHCCSRETAVQEHQDCSPTHKPLPCPLSPAPVWARPG